MTDRESRIKLLYEAAAERILVKEGPHGTYLQGRNLVASDYGGDTYEGCPEQLNVTRPDVVRDMHRGYLEAGADLLMSNTFGGMDIVLAEYDLQDSVRELNGAAVRLAREMADQFSTRAKPRFVMGDMGPTTKAITVTGGITFDELVETYYRLSLVLADAGADTLLLETQNDTRTIKAGLIGIWRAFDELGFRLPVMVSGTIEQTGTMLAGQSAEALATSLMHADLFTLGLNCSTGPEFMTDHLRGIAGVSEFRLSCWPNAGLPDPDGNYRESPQQVATVMERFVDEGWLNIIGGCCGTTPEHIRMLTEMAVGKKPRLPQRHSRALFSGVDFVEATDDNRPLIVGERTNEVGLRMAVGASRKDIMTQFVIEASMLGVIGGMAGIILGILGSFSVRIGTSWAISISPASVMLAVGFSLLVGLFFGVYPARRASLLDPIDALRSE